MPFASRVSARADERRAKVAKMGREAQKKGKLYKMGLRSMPTLMTLL